MPNNLALLYMQTERLCQPSFHYARQTGRVGLTKPVSAHSKYAAKTNIPLAGNQEFFTT